MGCWGYEVTYEGEQMGEGQGEGATVEEEGAIGGEDVRGGGEAGRTRAGSRALIGHGLFLFWAAGVAAFGWQRYRAFSLFFLSRTPPIAPPLPLHARPSLAPSPSLSSSLFLPSINP